MDKKEKLGKVINRIKTIPSHYFERSLFIDINEMMVLCNNIIENNVENIIEIGTYKGVTAAIFASIIDGKVYTININDDEIFYSKTLWDSLEIKNIVQIKGSSLDELPKLVDSVDKIGFVYVDGNHDIPYPAKEFEIINNSKIKNTNTLVYFDDGPLKGVMQAIDTYKLTKITGTDWMLKDEKNKGVGGTLRAYHIFGDFKFNENG